MNNDKMKLPGDYQKIDSPGNYQEIDGMEHVIIEGENEKYIEDLDAYINTLNSEKKPREHEEPTDSPELEELFKTVRMVRTLREPALPGKEFQTRLTNAVSGSLPDSEKVYLDRDNSDNGIRKRSNKRNKHNNNKNKNRWITAIASVAAVLVMLVLLNSIFPIFSTGRTNIVHAMENAYKNIKAYHGILEVVERNAGGNETIQSRIEVWSDKAGHYYVKGLEGFQKGLITVNNGQRKWQLRPGEQQLLVFPAFPDPYPFIFEIGKEIEEVKDAIETVIVGEDTISGRLTTILEVRPEGGMPYRVWVDKETNLPLQKQTAMNNALQYKVTYAEIEFVDEIPSELLTCSVPEGYLEIDTYPVQFVNTLEEAGRIAGFIPKMLQDIPPMYEQDGIAVGIDDRVITFYFTQTDNKSNKVAVLQGLAEEQMKPASISIIGQVGGNMAEIQSPVQYSSGVLGIGTPYAGITGITSIRWQQEGYEYAVVGNTSLDILSLFVENLAGEKLQIPTTEKDFTEKPEIEVEVDLEAEKNEQVSVDGGHSPWKLDPVYVAQVFVSLRISPEGIQGDYPVAYEDLEVLKNNGIEAVILVKDDNSPVSKVYLKKLIRQDSTGIWTVVGYDIN